MQKLFLISIFSWLATGLPAQNQASVVNTLRIGLLTAGGANPYAASVERGVRLGVAEAKQTANLFGADVQLYTASAGSDVVAAATQLSSQRKVQVLLGSSAGDAEALARFAERQHILFFNAASRAQSLRAACHRFTFHVAASQVMYSNAALLGQVAPLSPDRSSRAPGDSVVLWGPALERYGAAQINDRYRAEYGVGMDEGAWAGWAAVKIASESALRAKSTEPAKLLTYLESSATTFDGHKGWPLSFRLADHQLRQPLYVVIRGGAAAAANALRDVPDLRASSQQGAAEESARFTQALDRLVASPTAPRCPWNRR
jgi:hypothetical protein